MHLLQSSHESCEVSSGSNSKWTTDCHFCLLKLSKYLKNLSVGINISNTNKYFYPILYTCINKNLPMNPVRFPQDHIQNGWLIAIYVCSYWQNIWKLCPSGWISPTAMNIFWGILYTCINYNFSINPVKFRQDQIKNGQLLTIFVC